MNLNHLYNLGCCPKQVSVEVHRYQQYLAQIPLSENDKIFLKKVHAVLDRFFASSTWFMHYNCHDRLERMCSVTNRLINPGHLDHYKIELPIVSWQLSVAIDAGDRHVVKTVDAFAGRFFEEVGPFNLRGLGFLREEIVWNERGMYRSFEFANLKFRLPFFGVGFCISHLEIKYDSLQGCLDVVCEAENPLILIKDVSFAQVMANNPEFDFMGLIKELPRTVGGNFVREYVWKRMSPGETY